MRPAARLVLVVGVALLAGGLAAFRLLGDESDRAVPVARAGEHVPPPEAWTRTAADAVALASVAPACQLTRVGGDFDGDGARDVALVYARPRTGRPCDGQSIAGRYRVAVQLAGGARFERWLTPGMRPDRRNSGTMCAPGCAAFAAPDLDADGRSELALALGHGASELWFGVFRVGRSGLRRLGLASGTPLDFTYFGSVTHGGTVVCRTGRDGARLVVQGRYGAGGWAIYQAERIYRFDGRSFTLQAVREWQEPGIAPEAFAGRRCVAPIPGA